MNIKASDDKQLGADLRDIFAGLAMCGDWAARRTMGNLYPCEGYKNAAKEYYAMADAIMEVRNENNQRRD